MGTVFSELIRQTMFKIQPRNDGLTRIAVEQAINDAQKVIAATGEFEELVTLDNTNAFTVASTKSYHINTDWGLVRCKDILSIRLMSDAESRKLVWVPFRRLDDLVPYTEQVSTNKSKWYTQRGLNIELFPIPDAAYALYIQHSQWPAVLSADDDQTEFLNIDHIIVTLAADMAISSLEGSNMDWFSRARQLLGLAVSDQATRPDQIRVAQPFSASGSICPGEYWNNPWCKSQP